MQKIYKLYEEVGEGVSASVYRALCIPLNEIVAIKVLDLEKCNNDLDGIRREVHTMTLINHQNLLRAHCSFTAGHSLWVVMPYMAGGSCLHIMKSAYPEGFEEPVIATLLHEVLKALVYLHAHGHIHRDVKVLLMTLQNAPPGLDYERDKRFSKAKEADLLVQNKALYGDKEHLIAGEQYIRGISAWNFNLEDLKYQAALIQEDGMPNASSKKQSEKDEDDGFNDLHDLDSSLASFPIKPLQALKGCFDVCEDDGSATSPRTFVQENGRTEGETSGQSSYLPRHVIPEPKKFLSGSVLPDGVLSPKKVIGDGERDHLQLKHQPERNFSGPLLYRQKGHANNPASAEDMSEGAVVQRKGRFKVTSADLSPKGPSNCFFGPACGGSTSPATTNLAAATVLPSLQCILQQNSLQREEIVKLIKYVEQTSGTQGESTDASSSDLLQMPPASGRERELQSLVIHLQQSVENLVEQLQRQKLKNAQLERQLKVMTNKDENIRNGSEG
ncbi:hypothetical protein GBA52_011921 [Prunus armeniaca]|nr:hypothetical protein GBA52_011921 [Prunus armeniaca]